MQEPQNPYATPTAVNQNILQNNSAYEVYANQLIVDQYVEFPTLCFKTGEPVTPPENGKYYRKTLYSYSQWLALLILLGIIGIIIYIVIYYSTRKKLVVGYSLSDTARKQNNTKRIVGYGLSFLMLAASIYAFYLGSGYRGDDDFIIMGIVGIFLFLVGIIITNSISRVVRIKQYLNGRFFIAGAGQPFLQAIQNQR